MSSAGRTAVTDADFYLLEQSLEPEGPEENRLQRADSFVGRAITGLSAFG